MKRFNVVATSHVDAHNERITREALEEAAEAINDGDRPLLTLNHDTTLPPHGKGVSARVEAREDGEYQLVVENEIFEETEWLLLNDGRRLLRQESKDDHTPFVDRYEALESDGYEVSVDAHNFDSFEAKDAFIDELRSQDIEDFTHGEFGRKAAVPDPEIVVKLAETIVAYLLARDAVRKVADKVLDKVGDEIAADVAKFYEFCKNVITTFANYARPSGRPITYVFVVPRQPRIEFVVRTNDPNHVMSAILIDKLKSALEDSDHLNKALGATRIQYLLNDNGEWEFNYLLTKTGGVIGTERAFANRTRKFELMVSKKMPAENKDVEDAESNGEA